MAKLILRVFNSQKNYIFDFINLEKKSDLKDFFAKSLNFCVFPTDSEMQWLFKKYRRAGLRGAPVYYASYSDSWQKQKNYVINYLSRQF